MGAEPVLPGPTEPSTAESAAGNSALDPKDLSSDVSHLTDRTSYSIPDDGSPITISTRRKRQDRDREAESNLTRASHQSQTSLLIEYFEGGKGGSNVQSRPSVRVKVTPSAARKIKDTNDHIQISETGKNRQPSYTKRISLSPRVTGDKHIAESGDDRSLSSYASATEESHLATRGPPVEVEVMHRDGPTSASSSPRDRRYVQPNPSDISSMPPESIVEDRTVPLTPRRERSRTVTKATERSRSISPEEVQRTSETLKTPSRRDRSLSRERIAQKVIEKLGNKHVESSGKTKRRSKSRSRSVSKEHLESVKSPRRKSSRSQREEEFTSGPESSLLTQSGVSSNRKSVDQHSIRSGTSKSSINNPRLLETVEDAIRRLILPELNALRGEQHGHERGSTRRERDSVTSGDPVSKDESRRRSSKTSGSAEKPKVVLNRDEHGPGQVLSGDSMRAKKERRSHKDVSLSPSDSYERGYSEDTVVDEKPHKKRSKDRHGVRDAAAIGVAGALTAAALKHHDSISSVEKQERRKRRTKSRSRSASLAESKETLHTHKHEIPPMPMSSDIQGSEVTRESILTERTDRPLSATDQDRHTPVREYASPHSRIPVKPSMASPRDLRTRHSDPSQKDVSLRSVPSDRSIHKPDHLSPAVEAGLAAAGLAAAGVAAREHHDRERGAEGEGTTMTRTEQGYAPRANRALSPIQSVASYKEDSISAGHNRQSFQHTHSSGSLSSAGKEYQRKSMGLYANSASSSPGARRASQDPDSQYWYEQHQENERNRSLDAANVRDPTVDLKHMTNYTDDSLDGTYLDKVAAGQHVLGVGANPQYRHTPVAVSSAVASLHEPSVVDVRSAASKADDRSYPDSLNEYREGHEYGGSIGSYGMDRSAREDEDYVPLGASGLPVPDDPMPEIGHGLSDESDINTNPSIIQGPIGGVQHDNRDHWPYEPTPPHSNGNLLARDGSREDHDGLKAVEVGLLGAAAGAGAGAAIASHKRAKELDRAGYEYEQTPPKTSYGHQATVEDEFGHGTDQGFGSSRDLYQGQQAMPLKDEGYISAANPRSPGGLTPEPMPKGLGMFDAGALGDTQNADDDPFTTKGHTRHMSGNSHGMGSPLYDSATGKGIDRIQSQDVVALMDHLTVRDAQRNARDTEILVTLVRSAAEMRNSFEDMKRLLADQENNIISSTDNNTERSIQKVMHGPRPQPQGPSRATRRSAEDEIEDIPARRRNVFKRALKGLSMRSSNDLAKIEDMLVQLLGDVEGLKAAQDLRPAGTRGNSLGSYENLRAAPEGYEPEGQAGTGSTNQSGSGYFSNPPSRQASAMRGPDGRKVSEHRISTVPEADEEMAAYDDGRADAAYENTEHVLTPTRQSPGLDQHETFLTPRRDQVRAGSDPLNTPPQTQLPSGSHSNEHTPRTDQSRKHKSNSSSFFPKISRWSETTASTVARQFRGGGRRGKEYSEPASRSGSDIASWGDNQHDPHGADRLPGSREQTPTGQDRRPSSPLIPQGPQEGSPIYQAHRNSWNLKHPQPRPGPTYRYQTELESQADNYGYGSSVSSEQGQSNSNMQRYSGGSGNRHSGGAGNLSPISDGAFSQASAAEQTAPPRPPKIPDEPLVPAPVAADKPQYASPIAKQLAPQQVDRNRVSDGSAYSQANGSPRSASGQVPQRKPTGPRPITTMAAQGVDNGAAVRRNRNRDTFGGPQRDAEDDIF